MLDSGGVWAFVVGWICLRFVIKLLLFGNFVFGLVAVLLVEL